MPRMTTRAFGPFCTRRSPPCQLSDLVETPHRQASSNDDDVDDDNLVPGALLKEKGTDGGYLFGRHKECAVRFRTARISNRHCLIFKQIAENPDTGRQEESAYLEDMSTNGTFINGKLVGGGNRQKLKDSDEIQLARLDKAQSKIGYEAVYVFKYPERFTRQQSAFFNVAPVSCLVACWGYYAGF
ncbi:hypothetical protein HK104_005240 [Borealophlyctis nickersoniae]|nr:hypothetical protein HK104_005240 [Borealophlyctis nickersoniae]